MGLTNNEQPTFLLVEIIPVQSVTFQANIKAKDEEMDEPEQPLHPKYLEAIDKILDNLRDSDWISEAGGGAWRELREYRLDMAGDLQRVLGDIED